jgi:nucleoporin p58/p45
MPPSELIPPCTTAIASTLQVQHETFFTLASKTATVDAELQKIKALYTTLWRARTGSARDPFEDGVGPEGEGSWENMHGLSLR